MKNHATKRFWKCYNALPKEAQKQAKENLEQFKQNPYHPSLHLKNVGKFWSIRIGLSYRALAIKDNNDFIWVWIGTHEKYNEMIK